MTIIDIAKEIEAKKGATRKEINTYDWKPEKVEEYIVPEFVIPETRKKNSQREKFSKTLAFIDLVKRKRYAEGCTIMPIATTDKRLISICGSQREASRLIKFMINIGLLTEENKDYQWNADREGYNKSKTYRYYYDNEELIKGYCERNNINTFVIRNNIYDTVVDRFEISTFDAQKVRFSSKLHLLKPDNYSVQQFEDYLTAVLYQNYPELKYYQSMADEINFKYYDKYPEMALRFVPNFTWSKGNKAVRKIGIRCTNSYVSAKKEKDDKFNGYLKEDILKQYGLNLEKDVKSSVPRITLSLNVGRWIKEDIDIYEIIYNNYVAMREKDNYIDTVVDRFEKVRESVKSLHMRGYFDDEKMIGVHTRRVMANVTDKEAIDSEMKLYKEAIVIAEGGHLYDSEIFYHESCIYLDVLKELLENGFFVWQCYDAFYAKKSRMTQQQFELLVANIVEDKANQYINRYSSTQFFYA